MNTDLDTFLKSGIKLAEIKRCLAVQQDLAGKRRKEIASFLSVTSAFVSKWRLIYDEYGSEGLRSNHQGGKPRAFLNEADRSKVIEHLKQQELFGPTELANWLKEQFGVRFRSPQSYYDLLHEAGISWHKSQKSNPRRDETKVLERRDELKKTRVVP